MVKAQKNIEPIKQIYSRVKIQDRMYMSRQVLQLPQRRPPIPELSYPTSVWEKSEEGKYSRFIV